MEAVWVAAYHSEIKKRRTTTLGAVYSPALAGDRASETVSMDYEVNDTHERRFIRHMDEWQLAFAAQANRELAKQENAEADTLLFAISIVRRGMPPTIAA
jgi:hypothetical protein